MNALLEPAGCGGSDHLKGRKWAFKFLGRIGWFFVLDVSFNVHVLIFKK